MEWSSILDLIRPRFLSAHLWVLSLSWYQEKCSCFYKILNSVLCQSLKGTVTVRFPKVEGRGVEVLISWSGVEGSPCPTSGCHQGAAQRCALRQRGLRQEDEETRDYSLTG